MRFFILQFIQMGAIEINVFSNRNIDCSFGQGHGYNQMGYREPIHKPTLIIRDVMRKDGGQATMTKDGDRYALDEVMIYGVQRTPSSSNQPPLLQQRPRSYPNRMADLTRRTQDLHNIQIVKTFPSVLTTGVAYIYPLCW